MRPKQEQVERATGGARPQSVAPTRGLRLALGLALVCWLLDARAEPHSSASPWNNGTRRQSRVIHLKAAPFNGRLALAPDIERLPAGASDSAARQPKQLNESSESSVSSESSESNESNEPSESEQEHESNISALSPTLVLRPPASPKHKTLVSADLRLPEDWSNKSSGADVERASQVAQSADWPESDSTRLMASESVNRNVKGSEAERENQPGDSILSLIDDFDSTIVTNRTKGE